MVGSPNTGKSTLFNEITGSRSHVSNYPGTTVDYSKGSSLSVLGESLDFIDTPGIYSLAPKTDEEQITYNLLLADPGTKRNDVILSVIDATQFVRHVLITQQLIDQGFKVVVALTMIDVLDKNNIHVDVEVLSRHLNCPVVSVHRGERGDLKRLMGTLYQVSQKMKSSSKGVEFQQGCVLWAEKEYKDHFAKFQKIEQEVFSSSVKDHSNRIDRWLLHPVLGLVFFLLIMTLIFSSVFWLATPFIDIIDSFFLGLADKVMVMSPGSLWTEFLGNGLIAGVGAFMVFVPQIAVLFFILGLLEDSGYLARASSLVDRPLSKLGMNGRSFTPVLSSFACAVPAMMAARTIPNRKEKFLTLFILPLMTCSARIPVYVLIISFLFRGQSVFLAGLCLALLYFVSLIIGGVTASVINRFLPQNRSSFLIMELPSYRLPKISKILRQVLFRTNSFIKNAGPIILVLSMGIWFISTFPNYEVKDANERFQQSYAAQVGQAIEPVFRPMGADWRVGVGIIASFAAREVFVSTLASVFNLTEEDDDKLQDSLLTKMKTARFIKEDGSQGELIFTMASSVALLIFFMIALQCMATVGIAKNEFGGWKMALTQLFAFNIIAYVLAVLAYQVLS